MKRCTGALPLAKKADGQFTTTKVALIPVKDTNQKYIPVVVAAEKAFSFRETILS